MNLVAPHIVGCIDPDLAIQTGTRKDRRPGAAVPVEDAAARGPDIRRPAAADVAEIIEGARHCRGGPDAAVPVQDGAADADSPDVVGSASPDAREIVGR